MAAGQHSCHVVMMIELFVLFNLGLDSDGYKVITDEERVLNRNQLVESEHTVANFRQHF